MTAAGSYAEDAGAAVACCASGAPITDTPLPGGGREQAWDARNTSPAPPIVREHQLAGNSADYRQKVRLAAGLARHGTGALCAPQRAAPVAPGSCNRRLMPPLPLPGR